MPMVAKRCAQVAIVVGVAVEARRRVVQEVGVPVAHRTAMAAIVDAAAAAVHLEPLQRVGLVAPPMLVMLSVAAAAVRQHAAGSRRHDDGRSAAPRSRGPRSLPTYSGQLNSQRVAATMHPGYAGSRGNGVWKAAHRGGELGGRGILQRAIACELVSVDVPVPTKGEESGAGVGMSGAVERTAWERQPRRLATTSSAPSVIAAVPSRSTIAGHAVPAPDASAMLSIETTPSPTERRTQHWPWPSARTNAPCHTRNASPPGAPTGCLRKAAPVGRAPRCEDKERAATPTRHGDHVPRAVWRKSDDVMRAYGALLCVLCVPVRVQGRALDARAVVTPDVPPRSPIFPVTSFLSFSIHTTPSRGPSLLPLSVTHIALGTATASCLDLGGSIDLETVAILGLVAGPSPAVVRVAVASIEATRNRETRTIAFSILRLAAARGMHIHLNHSSSRTHGMCAPAGSFDSELRVPTVHHRGGFWASASSSIETSGNSDALAFLLLLFLRAFRDAGAGVHDSVAGIRTFRA